MWQVWEGCFQVTCAAWLQLGTIILAIPTSSVKCHGKFTQTKIIGINPQRNQTFMTFSSFILKEIDAFRFILKQ